MSDDTKNILKVSGVLVGSVIGAGFASGQEILQFFTIYCENGFKGIVLTIGFFCFLAAAVMEYVYKFRLKNYTDVIGSLAGRLSGTVIEVVVMFFLGISFFIMTAGAGALFKEYFGVQTWIGAGIISAACCLIFLFNFKGVIAINTILSPCLVISIGILGVLVFIKPDIPTFSIDNTQMLGNWFSSSLIYVSYNSIALITMVSTLEPYLSSRKVIYMGSFLGGTLLLLMALVIFFMTSMYYPEIMKYEIPIIEIVQRRNLHANEFYSIVLLAAMFVHAVTAGFCFLNRMAANSAVRFNIYAVIMCVLAVPLSSFGFSNMVKGIYPIFGYIGLFQVIIITVAFSGGYKNVFGVTVKSQP